MKIYEITEAIRPEHVPILNRMRAAGDKKSAVLANLIQAELQKANVPWDVAAELARDKYRELEDKKAQNRDSGMGRGKYTTYRDGTSRSGSSTATAQADSPSNITRRQQKKFADNPKLKKMDRDSGNYKSYDVDANFGSPLKRTTDLISRGADAIRKDADDTSKGVIRRTPSKLASLGIDAFKRAKQGLTPPPKK